MGQSKFETLVDLIARLRAPGGCPWDRAQTHDSIKGSLLEEAFETIAEIERGDPDGLREELGDVMLHVVFHAQIAAEANEFTIEEVIEGVAEKLVRRHPHVFGNAKARTPDDVVQTWERIKQQESAGGAPRPRPIDYLPALMAARKVQGQLEGTGQAVALDVDAQALESLLPEAADPEAAVGQLLFAAVSLARKLDVEPEWALKKATAAVQPDA